MHRYVLVTGASTGIGFETARALIAAGFKVFGTVRRAEDGERVARDLGSAFIPLIADVTDPQALAAAAETVSQQVGNHGLAALVNNAGVAQSGPLMHVPIDEVRQLFEVNVFGFLAATQVFLPLLGARRDCPHAPGRIVNISSISGGLTFPFVGSYAASKHAVEAMTDGLRRELAIYGIAVTAIEPGTIKTPIWAKGQKARVDSRYSDTDFGPILANLPAVLDRHLRSTKPVELVSDAVVHAITARRPRTRYPLTAMWQLRRWLPDRLMDAILRKEFGISKGSWA